MMYQLYILQVVSHTSPSYSEGKGQGCTSFLKLYVANQIAEHDIAGMQMAPFVLCTLVMMAE